MAANGARAYGATWEAKEKRSLPILHDEEWYDFHLIGLDNSLSSSALLLVPDSVGGHLTCGNHDLRPLAALIVGFYFLIFPFLLSDNVVRTGCRAGDACPFIHDPSRLKGHGRSAQRTENSSPDVSKPTVGALAVVASGSSDTAQLAITASVAQRRYESVPVDSSKVVQKPVSRLQADDPREFQMQQLRRRFSPKETTEEHGTVLTFKLIPSDPDFPFEMEGLDCVLHVPQAYPTNGKPRLDVRNKEMDRGYQINVERGFDALVAKSSRLTLLGLMNSLDKQLESLLTEPKAETIKLVANAYHESRGDKAKSSNTLHALLTDIPIKAVEAQPAVQTYTDEQKKIAQINRENETRQLEARLGRLPRFFKSSDGITYTIPIEPRRRGDLPVPLQIVKTVRLFVPMLYPLQSCRIEVQGVAREAAKNTESNFERKAKESHEMTLMGHINYLSQHMHVLATESIEEDVARPEQRALPDVASLQMKQPIESDGAIYTDNDFDDRSHIKVIPRPPEWAVDRREGEDDDENSDSPDAYDSEDDSMDDEGVQLPSSVAASHSVPDRGILISFPQLELYGIELLELVSLCITVKCERCKDPMDVNHLRDHTRSDALSVRTESCKKCANPLRAAYRSELMHVNSVRAGQLDLDGCTVIDMLPRQVPSGYPCHDLFCI